MATEAQIKANRLNAQKSTGPKTIEGKAKVSQNATKHGIFCRNNVISDENQDEYEIFCQELLEELNPAGITEEILAYRIVNLSWRLRRAERFQSLVVDALIDHSLHNQFAFDNVMRAQQQAKEGNTDLLVGNAINSDFAMSKSLERLLMYERRIENSLYKSIANLKKLQKERRDKQDHPHPSGMRMPHNTNIQQTDENKTGYEQHEIKDDNSIISETVFEKEETFCHAEPLCEASGSRYPDPSLYSG